MMNGLLRTILGSTGLAIAALAAAAPFNDTLTVPGAAQRNAVATHYAPVDPHLGADAVTTVVIDAGHGGHDGGCSGAAHGGREKTIALQIALGLGRRLQEVYPDMKVIYTRDRDVFVPLYERAAIANRAQADLFVSIHCNAMPNGSQVRGSETYVMGLHTAQHNLDVAKRENAAVRLEQHAERNYDFDPDSPAGHIILSMFQHAFLEQSMALAANIEDQLGAREGHQSRGVKQAGFLVLKETAMPSVLIETGYLTNAHEEAYLVSDAGQIETVESLYGGVARYLQYRGAQARDSRPMLAAGRSTAPEERPAPRPVSEPGVPIVAPAGKMPVGTAPVGKTDAGEVSFYVQLVASSSQVATTGAKWSRLGAPIRFVREGQLVKYQAGPFATREEAMRAQGTARASGFPGAFLAAYRDGEKLSANELR